MGKMRAMGHHASPPSSLIWYWLLVSFGEPLVTFLTALSEDWSNYIKVITPIYSTEVCLPVIVSNYIILSGAGKFQVDDEVFDIAEGSVIRVSTNCDRNLKYTSESPMT